MDDKFIAIPESIYSRTDLTSDEKLLYTQIIFLCKNDSGCNATNEYFSKLFGMNTRLIQRQLIKLYDKKLIMFQRTTRFSSRRVIVLYNKQTIKYYENGVLPDSVHLDYKK